MTQCWSEGELRAFLDCELPAGDMRRAAEHLSGCDACRGLSKAVEQRAERVAAQLGLLPAPAPVLQWPKLAPRTRPSWGWAAAGLVAAATLGFLLVPKRTQNVAIAPAPPQRASPAPAVPPAPPPQAQPAVIRRKLPEKPKPEWRYFVALDDAPIDTGLVVRVALEGGQIPAEVIFGPDGRARAIRLVSESSGERR